MRNSYVLNDKNLLKDFVPESLSVRVKVKDVASRKAVRLGPTLVQPSGWQK